MPITIACDRSPSLTLLKHSIAFPTLINSYSPFYAPFTLTHTLLHIPSYTQTHSPLSPLTPSHTISHTNSFPLTPSIRSNDASWLLLLTAEDEFARARSTQFLRVHPTANGAEHYVGLYRNYRFSDHLLSR